MPACMSISSTFRNLECQEVQVEATRDTAVGTLEPFYSTVYNIAFCQMIFLMKKVHIAILHINNNINDCRKEYHSIAMLENRWRRK